MTAPDTMERTAKRRAAKTPLYPSEAEIAELVLGPGRLDEWKGLAVVLERQGLPPVDRVTHARFWPAVLEWFRARHGLVSIAPGQLAAPPDGGETCPAPKPKSRRGSSPGPAGTVHKLFTGPQDRTW